jgi:hypothetical protein
LRAASDRSAEPPNEWAIDQPVEENTGKQVSRELLILHGGALGDLVLTLQLALRLPVVDAASAICVVGRADPGDLSTCRPSIERLSPEALDTHRLYSKGDTEPPERLRELVAGRRVLSAVGGVDSLVHRRLAELGAREVYSFEPRPRPGSQAHITMQWQRELEGQGVPFAKSVCQARGCCTLAVPDEVRERGRGIVERAGGLEGGVDSGGTGHGKGAGAKTSRPWHPILIHPGSGGRAKCWPLRGFLEVGRRLRERGREACFVVGPVETECWTAEELDAIRDGFPLVECPTPDELSSVLAVAGALVSNDCGPAHLAALLGTPTVTIFGPTLARIWGPLGPAARVLQGDPRVHSDDWGISCQRVLATLPI